MKKLAILSISVMFIFAMTSCKKNHTCSCTYDPGTGTNVTQEFPYGKVKKGDAETLCTTQQSQFQIIDPNANCTLN